MKLSSISFIATAIATIAGGAIAAAGPFYSGDVNQFKRNLDVYSRESGVAGLKREVDGEPPDNSFTHSWVGDHEHTARVLRVAAEKNIEAADDARIAANRPATKSREAEVLWDKVRHHRTIAAKLWLKEDGHIRASRSEHKTNRHNDCKADNELAEKMEASAYKTKWSAGPGIQRPPREKKRWKLPIIGKYL